MKIIGIIPSRYQSTRLPGKPLIDIAGKPMIQHVYERALESDLDDVIIACDDDRICVAIEAFDGKYVKTQLDHLNGSSRIAEVASKIEADVIINIQGDEPLISPEAINAIINAFKTCPDENCVTLKAKIGEEADISSPNVVKVVTNLQDYALIFSRSPIPYKRMNIEFDYYKHIGIYGYKRAFLLQYVEMEPSLLEKIESLEQLRILENGFKIKVFETNETFIGVDTDEDLEKVRNLLNDKED